MTKFHGWTVTEGRDDKDRPFTMLEHPEYKQVISIGESGADPGFAHDNAHLAALDETLRNEPGNAKAKAARDELDTRIQQGKRARAALNGVPAAVIQAEAARLVIKKET